MTAGWKYRLALAGALLAVILVWLFQLKLNLYG